MIRKMFCQQPENSACRFFYLIISLGVFSIVLILSLALLGLERSISRQVFHEAENDAVHVSRAILALEKGSFLSESEPGLWQVRISEAEMAPFDQRMRSFLTLFEISKIKIYDQNCRVIYSTDGPIIGLLDTENPRLARALAGSSDSALKRKESLLDLAMEEKFYLDVVETYIPISLEKGRVIGAFEIYRDITRSSQTIASLTRKNVAILALVLLLVFTPSMLVVRLLTRNLALAQKKLKEQASVDALSGVLSRSEALAQALDRIFCPHRRRSDAPPRGRAGIVMLDIDHFKSINDTYGHIIGDLAIKAVAQRMVTVFRQDDIVGRYGGDEFFVVLPESDQATTRYLGERIRRIIADNPSVCREIQLSITVSVGVSWFAGSEEQDFFLALEEADKALYLAKNRGRNHVCHLPAAQDGWQVPAKTICAAVD